MSTLQELLKKADFYKQKISSARPLKDYCETASDDLAYDFMLEQARQQSMDITEETIKKLHYLFYQKVNADEAGQYRSSQVYISGTKCLAPDPDEVPRLMNHLTDQIRSSQATLHPIELAAMAHKRLMDIHPFTDGNGRTAQLLMNLILVNKGYGVISIPPIRQDDYINALSASRRQKDMEPFSKLIAECVIDAQQEY